MQTDRESPEIRVSALVLRVDGAMLMVRKRGTTAFMLPGGKPERAKPRSRRSSGRSVRNWI